CRPELPQLTLAKRLSTRAVPGAWNGIRRLAKPSGASAAPSASSAPSSAGVTLGQRISAWARATGSRVMLVPIGAAPTPPHPNPSPSGGEGLGARYPQQRPLSPRGRGTG